jgi:hypothetical protein
MSATLPLARTRSRRTLVWLALLFFAPLAASFLIYYGSSWRPSGHTNHGTLIDPPRSLSALGAGVFSGRWSLVYVGGESCDDDCRAALYFMRQIHLGLGHLVPRVQRVFIGDERCCDEDFLAREHPGLRTVNPAAAERAALLAQFPANNRERTLYIVDPRGNLMMRYDTHADPRGLHEDLEKLLNLSHIG